MAHITYIYSEYIWIFQKRRALYVIFSVHAQCYGAVIIIIIVRRHFIHIFQFRCGLRPSGHMATWYRRITRSCNIIDKYIYMYLCVQYVFPALPSKTCCVVFAFFVGFFRREPMFFGGFSITYIIFYTPHEWR